jgi:hypothetical protein
MPEDLDQIAAAAPEDVEIAVGAGAKVISIGTSAGDLPLNFHPAAVRVSGFCTPSGTGAAHFRCTKNCLCQRSVDHSAQKISEVA